MGQVVAARRLERRLTQKQLAEKAGITINFLSLIETGRRGASMEVLERLAKILKARWIMEDRT